MNQISSITYLAQDTFEKILRDIYEDNFFGWVADKIPSDKNMHSSIPCNLRRYIEDIGLYLNVMQQYFRDSSKTHGWDGGEFRFFYSQLYYHLGITIEFLEYFTRTGKININNKHAKKQIDSIKCWYHFFKHPDIFCGHYHYSYEIQIGKVEKQSKFVIDTQLVLKEWLRKESGKSPFTCQNVQTNNGIVLLPKIEDTISTFFEIVTYLMDIIAKNSDKEYKQSQILRKLWENPSNYSQEYKEETLNIINKKLTSSK